MDLGAKGGHCTVSTCQRLKGLLYLLKGVNSITCFIGLMRGLNIECVICYIAGVAQESPNVKSSSWELEDMWVCLRTLDLYNVRTWTLVEVVVVVGWFCYATTLRIKGEVNL